MAHTPGPWRVAPASDYTTGINVDAGTRGYVCLCGDGDEAAANARLIAAAPELLEKLRALIQAEHDYETEAGMKLSDPITDAVAEAEAVLAKLEPTP